MKKPFVWDIYSDQPSQLKDRDYKKKMRKKAWFSLLKTIFTALFILPFALLFIPFRRSKIIQSSRFFGLSINLDKEPALTPELIHELNVRTFLIRFKLWEMDRINDYLSFVHQLEGKTLLLNIMQDREHIEDSGLLEKDLRVIFETFSPYVYTFQIGTTINRAKWGFFSVDEYLRFYQVAYRLQQTSFPAIKLIGSNVIDFEYHFTIHSLFNFFHLHYDGIGALLYVDRRGAPENKQMGFSLFEKITLLSSILYLSPKSSNQLYITETNWPISGTAPYAPTSETECVDEESYADFMVRYYIIAFASQSVDAVYWHQLIAPGYGLIDNREGLRKRTAFYAFKTMIEHLNGASFIRLSVNKKRYTLICQTDKGLLHVIWSSTVQHMTFTDEVVTFTRDGSQSCQNHFIIGPSPIYIYPENTNAF